MSRKVRKLAIPESHFSRLMTVVAMARKYLAERSYIEKLDEKLQDVEIVSPENVPVDQVEMDTSVRVTDLDRDEQKVYKLVFPNEAKPGDHVSVIAPLGSALLGARVGEVVEVDAPAKKRRVRIDEIITETSRTAA